MGLIRKSLMLGTGGVVSGSSKKQRVAREIARNTKDAARYTAALEQTVRAQADEERRFRYDTDATYRAWVDEQEANRVAAAAAITAAREATLARRREARVLRRAKNAQQWRAMGRGMSAAAHYVIVVPALGLALVFWTAWVVVPVAAVRRRWPDELLEPLLRRFTRRATAAPPSDGEHGSGAAAEA